jgi:hypothetical protein
VLDPTFRLVTGSAGGKVTSTMRKRLVAVTATFIFGCGASESDPAAIPPDSAVADSTSTEVAIDATGDAQDASRSHPVLDQSCSSSSNMNSCDKCLEEHCCETRDACNAECNAIFTCFKACTEGPAVCTEKCMDAHPTGAAGYAAQNACVNLYCTTPCSGKPDACRDCRLANCALEHVTCFADPDCRRYGYCYEACTDAACDEACRSKVTPAVVKTYHAYESCLNKRCAASC